jgi:uncharacterized protein (UPF0276 family)
MAGAEIPNRNRLHPALATTYEGDDPALLERILPLIDTIEIAPDAVAASRNWAVQLRDEVLDEYASALPDVDLIAHGVGLSIGSFDGWDESYLRLLDQLFARFDLHWHSEHLACSVVAGEHLGTMLALPRTHEVLDLVCDRVRLIQERYRVPFLLEHVIHLLPDAPAEFTPAAFLNAITSRTGCGLILDAYNLECDAHNQGVCIESFLAELDLGSVRELHLAGGVQHDGFYLDIHSRRTDDATLSIGLDILRRAPNLDVVTYEFLKEAVPLLGHEGICAELARIRQAISETHHDQHRDRTPTARPSEPHQESRCTP